MHLYRDYFPLCSTYDLYQFTGTDFFLSDPGGKKRKEIQDVQVPQYVYGCGRKKSGTDEG